MRAPKRIQRKRTAGAKLPPNTLCATRWGKFCNPFKIGHRYAEGDSFLKHYGHLLDDGLVTPENCLTAFDAYLDNILAADPEWLDELLNYDFIACWCSLSSPCHVDRMLKRLVRRQYQLEMEKLDRMIEANRESERLTAADYNIVINCVAD